MYNFVKRNLNIMFKYNALIKIYNKKLSYGKYITVKPISRCKGTEVAVVRKLRARWIH